MASLRESRRKLKRALVALLLVDAAVLGLWLSPLVRSPKWRLEAYNQLHSELLAKRRQAAAVEGIDGKLERARTDIQRFYEGRLPERQSEIAAELGVLAKRHRVQLSQVSYATEAAELADLSRVEVQAALEGNYVEVIKFINALERDELFFIINSISLDEQQGGAVKLQIVMETYTRTA